MIIVITTNIHTSSKVSDSNREAITTEMVRQIRKATEQIVKDFSAVDIPMEVRIST